MEEALRALPPRWLIVVRRNRREIYDNLRQAFEADARVEVIEDRRRRERRRRNRRVEAVASLPQRRRGQRREPLPPTEQAFGRHAGFVVVVRD